MPISSSASSTFRRARNRFGVVFHILHGFQQAGEGTVLFTGFGIDPVAAIRPLDDAGVIVVSRSFGYGVFHGATSVP
jgi:hypothetical protein